MHDDHIQITLRILKKTQKENTTVISWYDRLNIYPHSRQRPSPCKMGESTSLLKPQMCKDKEITLYNAPTVCASLEGMLQ